MRYQSLFNDAWLYLPAVAAPNAPDGDFAPVTLPHANAIVPHSNVDPSAYAFVSTYRKHFTLPEPRAGRRVFLDFDGAMIAGTVTLNGHTFAEQRGGYTPFSLDVTDAVREDGDNLLTVRLDSTEREDIPPYGNVVDYLTFGGIYRDVYLRMTDPCRVERIYARSVNVLSAPSAEVDVELANGAPTDRRITVVATLRDASGQVLGAAEQTRRIAASASESVTLAVAPAAAVALWSIDSPALYTMTVELRDGGQVTDRVQERFAFREARFEKDGRFYLNGKPLKLFGLDRHQTYPFIGGAAPARLQSKDAEIIKDELNCNVVRTSHYPQSPHFLARCDEIGLLVFEEIPGWQHIGDDAWQQLSLRDLRAMIERDRNHPSIILWGVRINESPDNDALYEETNTLAHQLDPYRQTGGVRNFTTSRFLEDVYTYNDFSNTIIDPTHSPHLITEFSGHMYPTKTWDNEQRLVEHALRHARIQDKQLGMDRVAGAIGWCAFDYNTHWQFGSGDRVCYHGVMDIYRLPKFAAYLYASQVAPDKRVVLHAATAWTMGEYDGSRMEALYVFTNCEEVEVFAGEHPLGRYQPERERFPNLAHPPTATPMGMWNVEWGRDLPDLRVVGYVGGAAVAEQRVESWGVPRALTLEVDDAELFADGADMTRLIFKAVDRYGNPLPFAISVVTFAISGPGELIGENPFALVGGQAALYVRAGHAPGEIVVSASTPGLPSARARLRTVMPSPPALRG